MVSKTFILTLVFLSCISNVLGISFVSDVNLNGVVGSSILLPVNITNDNSESIFSVGFIGNNFSSSSLIDSLGVNKSGFVVIKVTPVSSGDSVLTLGSSFVFHRDIPRSPKTFTILLNDTDYSPATLT